MWFSWLRNRRRQRILARPFPPMWEEVLRRDFALYGRLPPSQQCRLRDDLRLFLADRYWEGCKGLQLSEEIKATISAQACYLLLGLDLELLRHVKTILVYPGSFRRPGPHASNDFLMTEEGMVADGEAWETGQVVLAWDKVLEEGRNPQYGRNLVFHEFAHQLDRLSGSMNGQPPLPADLEQTWREVFEEELRRLREAHDRGEEPLMEEDATDSETELFAVATEYFFCVPGEFQQEQPDLYDLLKGFYGQDPLTWSHTR